MVILQIIDGVQFASELKEINEIKDVFVWIIMALVIIIISLVTVIVIMAKHIVKQYTDAKASDEKVHNILEKFTTGFGELKGQVVNMKDLIKLLKG